MGPGWLRPLPLDVQIDETIEKKLNLWQKLIDEYWGMLTDPDMWESVIQVAVRIALILIFSQIAKRIAYRVIDHLTHPKSSKRFKLRTRRVQTVGRLLKNTVSYVLNFVVILLVLGEFHINLAPLLAGAGVVGLAIGFGAQSLVKDVITGFFIILEDHFSVGDVIETGKFRGTVEMIGLRATRIKSWTGEVYVIPNGSITDVTNFSVNNSLAVVDVSIAATEQLDQAMEVVRGVLAKFEDPNLVGAPELLGVQSMNATDVVLRITAVCRPNTQTALARHLNAEIKKGFEAAGDPRYYKAPALERTGG
ncbi:mechanosensitive ion channel family protein [Cohnella thermotolerans]|jgi:small-conductance mechanosensitive channel|uniref:mechanosensitive ion channel family protein n=1 Tax=Cohnella thermotolerans TaxID=329858 RepID=UPI0004166C10|nr:mechanosensitive ion channel family protein [Cohnella thermotolerans]